MADLEARLRRARPHLEVAWSDDEVGRVQAGMERKRARRRATRATVVTLLVLGAIGLGAKSRWTSVDTETVRLADGTDVTLPDAKQLARKIEGHDRVLLELRHGKARFDVFHDPKRPFRVEAGAVAVEVLGTRFELDRGLDQTTVSVIEGRVAVFSAEGRRELGAGQRVSFAQKADAVLGTDRPETNASASAATPTATSALPVAAAKSPTDPTAAPTPATVPTPAPVATARPRPAAASAVTARAPDTARPSDTPRPSADDPSTLIDEADRARETGHPADAVAPLRRLIAKHPYDARAPLAAFTLGRILLERLNRPKEAADAFAQAQQPITALHEDALAREVYAAARAGDTARAHLRALAYVERYPAGPHLAAVRRAGKLE